MTVTFSLKIDIFYQLMILIVGAQSGESPAGRSERKGFVRCVHKCCYCRERRYCPFEDLNDFGYVIQVKENAPDLLRRALSRVLVDVVGTGDYQAAEHKFGLSRRMLSACKREGLPATQSNWT